MNESQLVGWLTHLGLEKHVSSFKEYEVTGAVLSGYDDDELKYCIRPKADREKLMNAIAALPATVAPRVVAAAGIAPAAGGADSPTGGSKVARRIAAKRKTAQAMAAVRIQAKFRQKRAKREVQAKLAEKHKREAAAAAAGASFLSHFGHLRNPFGVVFRAFVLTFVARVAAAAEEERQQRLQAQAEAEAAAAERAAAKARSAQKAAEEQAVRLFTAHLWCFSLLTLRLTFGGKFWCSVRFWRRLQRTPRLPRRQPQPPRPLLQTASAALQRTSLPQLLRRRRRHLWGRCCLSGLSTRRRGRRSSDVGLR